MFKRALIWAALVATVTTASVKAQQVPSTNSANSAYPQKFVIPGTGYELVLGAATFSQKENADILLTALTFWIAEKSGLPANYELPKLAFVSAARMVEIRYKSLFGAQGASTGGANSGQRETLAIYDDATRTIYLRDNWTGQTPAELSILIHDLVHHLQNLAQIKHECPLERERLAYRVQNQWLWLFDSDLSRDFDIDPFTLLVTTGCGY